MSTELNQISPYTNEEFNMLLDVNKPYTKAFYKGLPSNSIETLEGTTLDFLADFKILICSKHKVYLDPKPEIVLKHFKTKHNYDKIPNTNKLVYSTSEFKERLINFTSRYLYVPPNRIDEAFSKIDYNTFYFKNLELELNGYKCSECLFITLVRKEALVHLNKQHSIKASNRKSEYIIENIPVQVLQGFKANKKYMFIPRLNSKGKAKNLESLSSNSSNSSNNSSSLNKTESKSYKNKLNTIKQNTLNQGLKEDINKEDFFINKTRYNRYLEGKNITDLYNLVDLSSYKEDSFSFFIYNTTRELNLESFNIIEVLSIGTRKSINRYFLDNNTLIVKSFKELQKETRNAYIKPISMFFVYLYNYYIKYYNSNFNRPLLSNEVEGYIKEINAISLYYKDESKVALAKLRLKPLVLKIVNSLLVEEIGLSFNEHISFKHPLITYFILSCLDINKIRELENTNTIIFRDTNYIESLLSKLIYTIRLLLVAYINYNELSSNLESFIEARISNRVNNCFNELYTLRTRLKYYNKSHISLYKPITNINENTLAFKDAIISIPKLKIMFSNRLKELEGLFFKSILCFSSSSSKDSIINIDFNKIKDSKENKAPLEDITSSKYLKELKNSILNRSRDKKTLIYKALNSKKNREKSILSYFELVSRFLKLLALNILLLSSSPLRGRAILLINFRNSSAGSLRNILFDSYNKLLSLDTTTINKNSNELAKINDSTIRYLPIRLTRIIIYYITFIVPLLEFYRIEYLGLKELDTKLFGKLIKAPISTLSISKDLRKSTKYYFDNKLGIKEYRHLIIYIIKERVLVNKPDLLSLSKRPKENYSGGFKEPSIDDRLANHSRSVVNRNYSRETNFFDNKTRDTTYRSLEFCKLYFSFFNLNNDRSIESILSDKNTYSIKSTTDTSSLYSNKSKRDNSSLKKGSIIELSSLDSSSISANSNDELDTTTNFSKSANSSLELEADNDNISPLRQRTLANTSFNRLTSSNLEVLEHYSKSPSKQSQINSFINTTNKESSRKARTKRLRDKRVLESSSSENSFISLPRNNNLNDENEFNYFDDNNGSSDYNIEPSFPLINFEENNEPSSFNKEQATRQYPSSNIGLENLNIASSLAIPSSINRPSSKRSFSNRESLESNSKDKESSNKSRESNLVNFNADLIELEEQLANTSSKPKRGRPKKQNTGKRGRPKKQ